MLDQRTGQKRNGRFKLSHAMKNPGVEWLGMIPAHWELAPVYARYDVALGKMLDAKRVTGEFSGRYLRNVDVQWDSVNTEDLLSMDFAPSERDRYLLRPGDLLVCEGGEVGRTAIWAGAIDECFYQKAIHRLRPLSEKDAPRFFYYLMYTLASRGVFAADGNPNTIDHLTATQLRHYRLPFPPLPEQLAISQFLDAKTATLNELIGKKERLIELLQEKRTALITRVVTKGHDPNVPMKDSGVEWLGQVPVHWEVLPLALATVSRCDGPFGSSLKSDHYSESGVRVIRLQNIGSAEFLDEDRAYLDAAYARELGDHNVIESDLLIAGLGDEGHPVGRACEAPEGIAPAMVKADCFRFRLNGRRVVPRFAAYQLSATALAAAGSLATGATRSRMNLTATASRKIAIPPIAEQLAVVDMLGRVGEQHASLITRVHEAIERLRELRTALISAAVTGKIDVRGEAPNLSEDA